MILLHYYMGTENVIFILNCDQTNFKLPGTSTGTWELKCSGTELGPSALLAWLNRPNPHWYTQPVSGGAKDGQSQEVTPGQTTSRCDWRGAGELTGDSERMSKSCCHTDHRLAKALWAFTLMSEWCHLAGYSWWIRCSSHLPEHMGWVI